MNDQKTIQLVTPDGKALELKNYMTARERSVIRSIFVNDFKIDVTTILPNNIDNQPQQKREITGEQIIKSEEKIIETLVISFDGSSENIINRIMDGSPEDYDFIVEETTKITKGNLKLAK